MPSDKRKLGDICETIAVKHLVKHKYKILGRNYLKKWGEIDIIAKDSVSRPHTIHFIEVKGKVSRESTISSYRPEENVHPWKLKRLWRAIQTWLAENKVPDDVEWQIDVMAVILDEVRRKAKIRWTKNIIIE